MRCLLNYSGGGGGRILPLIFTVVVVFTVVAVSFADDIRSPIRVGFRKNR